MIRIAFLSAFFWGCFFLISLWWNLQIIEQHAADNMINRGRFVFQMIETTRLWNARHGGVYVKKNDRTPSNPYLETSEKDIKTPSGIALTKVNPAYMTRQMSELILQNNDTKVHLTSLDPINPDNLADEWESNILHSFEQGVKEHIDFLSYEGSYSARYMAPLYVKTSCLECHEKQGYREGDVRGGISVTFSAEPFMNAVTHQKINMSIIHFAIWLLLSSFTFFLFKKIRDHKNILVAEKEKQEGLVELRTMALKKEVQLRRSTEEKIRLMVDTSAQALLSLDIKGRVTFANVAALSILGYDHDADITGQMVYDLLQTHDDKGNLISKEESQFIAAFSHGIPGHSEDDTFQKTDGSQLAVEYHILPLYSDDKLTGAVINFSDISNRKMLQLSMWKQANYDHLTNIPNRSLFMDRLKSAINQAKRSRGLLALLYLDLDGFKKINDTYGHYAGDQVLITVASRIKKLIRKTDTIARLGGDEFIILQSNINRQNDALFIAEKIINSIKDPIDYETHSLQVGISIGIALFPDDADDSEKLLKIADKAMYQAKENPGSNIYFFKNIKN